MKLCRRRSSISQLLSVVIRIAKLIVTVLLCHLYFFHAFSTSHCLGGPARTPHPESGRERRNEEIGKWSGAATAAEKTVLHGHHQQLLQQKQVMVGSNNKSRSLIAAAPNSQKNNNNLASIGSAPPKCIKRCSDCTPCQPIRVPVQPGRAKLRLMEYYPEAWRCKCKNKLYMP